MPKVYEELVEFLAQLDPQALVRFRPSAAARRRVAELLSRQREGQLSPDEQEELEHYMLMEHLFRLAKARAREILHEA
ncbi:MAG: hypothetical protein NZM28_03095 [Fimbriimonadales bacterium]|nr:hypothetical protein [Fimbriimonadales bacterium]